MNHNLAFSGGSSQTKYRASLNYFEREGVIYMFELRTEWFEEFNAILDDIDVSVSPEDDDEDEGGPMGGYFSKN